MLPNTVIFLLIPYFFSPLAWWFCWLQCTRYRRNVHCVYNKKFLKVNIDCVFSEHPPLNYYHTVEISLISIIKWRGKKRQTRWNLFFSCCRNLNVFLSSGLHHELSYQISGPFLHLGITISKYRVSDPFLHLGITISKYRVSDPFLHLGITFSKYPVSAPSSPGYHHQ